MPEIPEPELWSDETVAEFLLNNSMTEEGYRWAINEVMSMGVDPRSLNPKHLFHLDAPWRDLSLYLDPSSLKQTV